MQFFKKKIKNNHKSLSSSNMIYNINTNKVPLGNYIVLNYIKVSYGNFFLGFIKTGLNCIFLKKLPYGFSYEKIYENNDSIDIEMDYEDIPKSINADLFGMSFFNLFSIDYSYKIFNVKLYLKNYRIASSAGTYCLVLNKDYYANNCTVKLPSSKEVLLNLYSTLFIGRNSNIFSKYRYLGKYFYTLKYKNTLPKVRGVAKNPVDHPNGGRSKIKKPFKNPWGCIAKKGK